jgi:hypothetical protein
MFLGYAYNFVKLVPNFFAVEKLGLEYSVYRYSIMSDSRPALYVSKYLWKFALKHLVNKFRVDLIWLIFI